MGILQLLATFVTVWAIIIPLIWGDEPERLGAKVFAAMYALSIFRGFSFGTSADEIDLFGMLTDIFGFVGFFWIALFAWRIWPLWASALQLIAISAHLVRILEIEMDPLAYLFMRFAPSYLVSIILLVVCLQLRWQGSVSSNNLCWRDWSGRSIRNAPKK